MLSRRTFLTLFGSSVLFLSRMFGQETSRRRTRWEMIANDEEPETPRFKPNPALWDDTTITAAWLGHATVLINFFGTRILTDPVFSTRVGLTVGGLFTIGPKRLVLPALTIDELPPIDILLISHAHMDHLDTPSLVKFPRTTPLVMAKNTVDVVEDFGFQEIYELDWGDWTQIGDVRIEALEVKHFGWRYPWEKDRSRGFHEGRSYNAYLVSKNGHSIVFGGDTAYHEMFLPLAQRVPSIDLAIMPIGAYDPWIHNHANPEQALAMTDQMGASYMLPIHWRTFIQSEEPTLEPMQRLKTAAALQPDRIVLDSVGQTWSLASATADASSPRDPGTDASTPRRH